MTAGVLTALSAAKLRPRQREKLPHCAANCATRTDVRAWIGVVAQRAKLGLSDDEALARAWTILTAVNPLPATVARICPHPCEKSCLRAQLDGAVAINALERFLGDWGLRRRLRLPCLDTVGARSESVGVVGAGPAGLSFSYQMARRGYRVTLYEKEDKAGGMLFYGIPQYRLPESVLEAEVDRILELGIDLRLNAKAGKDIPASVLRKRHDVLFLAIGAGRALTLGIAGEEGVGVWTGIDYLALLNRGQAVELGRQVVVIGGGNTAIDAARAARRTGASVTLLYRRTRAEMPAIEAEVDDAVHEGVQIEYLATPIAIERVNGAVRSVVVQRMQLGDPDASGRRGAVPIAGSTFDLWTDTVITAVSQEPDWQGLTALQRGARWMATAADGRVDDRLWAGGDSLGLGIAARAISDGRGAAEAAHAYLSAHRSATSPQPPAVRTRIIKDDYYGTTTRVVPARMSAAEALTRPDAETQDTISQVDFLREASRCFSCGSCFGCEQCFMYCNAGAFTRVEQPEPGRYFALDLSVCEECGKCIDVCPCGFLEQAETFEPADSAGDEPTRPRGR